MKTLLILLLLAVNSIECSVMSPGRIYVDTESSHLVDSYGRIRLFRGLNFVKKEEPYLHRSLLNKRRQRSIADLGFNIVRLGTMWSGWQPHNDSFNQCYIDDLKKIVKGLNEQGIYVLLDLHQDGLFKVDNEGYWGFPKWVQNKFPRSNHTFPWPLLKGGDRPWWCNYFSEEISDDFQNLYDDKNGVAGDMAKFWRSVAKEFKNIDGVLGYELLNEPFAGAVDEDLALLLPGVAGRRNLAPFYERLNSAIRSVDSETLVFWEPVPWAFLLNGKPSILFDFYLEAAMTLLSPLHIFPLLQYICDDAKNIIKVLQQRKMKPFVNRFLTRNEGKDSNMTNNHIFGNFYYNDSIKEDVWFPSTLGTGFLHVPGGDNYRNRTVMSWHHYCWVQDPSTNALPSDPLIKYFCEELMGKTAFANVRQRSYVELNRSANMLTEFGLCVPSLRNRFSEGSRECEFVLRQAEKGMHSWIYWDVSDNEQIFWKNEDSSSNEVDDEDINWDTVSYFSRPYARAIAGSPLRMKFDMAAKKFVFEFVARRLNAPTELFVPSGHFGDHFCVSVSKGLKYEKIRRQIVNVELKKGAKEGERHKVFIQRC